MAFSTIQGTGGAPDLFVGTSGVDSITITNLNDAVDLRAFDSDDNITVENVAGVVANYTLLGGSGNDTFATTATTLAAASRINGNQGNDTITLGAFGAVSQTSSTVVGGKGNDTILLTGSLNSSLVNGNLDDDTITTAGASNSSVFGGQGVDTINIVGTTVLTVVNGDKGSDVISVAGNVNQSTINGGDGNDRVNLLAGITSFTDSSVFGGEGNDTLNAVAATLGVRLFGDAGNDGITGGTGNDVLQGGIGIDTIAGGVGTDTIVGGVGADLLTGGAGPDTFTFNSGDSFTATAISANIATFSNGVDVVTDFNNIIAGNANNDTITFTGGTATNASMTGGLGVNASILANGTVQINQAALPLSAGINNVYVAGVWNANLNTFTSNLVGGVGTDIMLFQATLAAPLAANTALNITSNFNTAEAVVLDNPDFLAAA